MPVVWFSFNREARSLAKQADACSKYAFENDRSTHTVSFINHGIYNRKTGPMAADADEKPFV